MELKKQLVAQNIVLVASNINVNLFNQGWFLENQIIASAEMQGDSVFVPNYVSLSLIDCQFVIVPTQIQISLKYFDIDNTQRILANRVVKFMNALNCYGIKAVGINFSLTLEDETGQDVSLKLLKRYNNKVDEYFKNDDARFGAYYSQNVDDVTRLKLDIKPIKCVFNGTLVEKLLLSFNFHSESSKIDFLFLQRQIDKFINFRNCSERLSCLFL